MKINIAKCLLILSAIFLTACSPIELYQAESSYEEARLSKNEKRILASLKQLAILEPEQYQGKLNKAELAALELQKAKLFLSKKIYI